MPKRARWNRAYVVVWKLHFRRPLELRTIPYPTRRWAERRLRKDQRRYPDRDLRVARLPLF